MNLEELRNEKLLVIGEVRMNITRLEEDLNMWKRTESELITELFTINYILKKTREEELFRDEDE